MTASAAAAALRRLQRFGEFGGCDIACGCGDLDLDRLPDAVRRVLDLDEISIHRSHAR
jgi:hypothetical protein